MAKEDYIVTISNKSRRVDRRFRHIESLLAKAHDKIDRLYDFLCINYSEEKMDTIESKLRDFIRESVDITNISPGMKEIKLPIQTGIDSAKHILSENKSTEDIAQSISGSLSACNSNYANNDIILNRMQKKVDDWNAERFNQIEKLIYDKNFEVYYGRIRMVDGESYLIDAGRVLNKDQLYFIRIFRISDYETPVITQVFQAAYTNNRGLEDGSPRLLGAIMHLINASDKLFKKFRNMVPKELDLSEYGIKYIPYIGKDIKVKYVDRKRKDDWRND